MEISKLKEEVKRLEGELRGCDQGIEALTKRADLVDQVISLEVEAITARDFLKEPKLSRGEDIANVVDEALAKFKSLKELLLFSRRTMTPNSTPGWR